jgi:hypothetical protein
MSVSTIRSPKRRPRSKPTRADWFRYYADFSAEFVEDIISHLDLRPNATLLDPWLGAGTTAEVATVKGLRFKGYDINPAMLLVSRARTIPTTDASQIPMCIELISRSYGKSAKRRVKITNSETDPLEQWLQPGSAHALRVLERTVHAFLFKHPTDLTMPLWRRAHRASPASALFYVGLFRTLRHFISTFQSSNPTWIKVSQEGHRIRVSRERLVNRFVKEIQSLEKSIRTEAQVMPSITDRRCQIRRASSLALPLRSGSIEAVVSSPPYCTRIDYVRATLPELAVIGFPDGVITRRLREQMIGTPTIDKRNSPNSDLYGKTWPCAPPRTRAQQCGRPRREPGPPTF